MLGLCVVRFHVVSSGVLRFSFRRRKLTEHAVCQGLPARHVWHFRADKQSVQWYSRAFMAGGAQGTNNGNIATTRVIGCLFHVLFFMCCLVTAVVLSFAGHSKAQAPNRTIPRPARVHWQATRALFGCVRGHQLVVCQVCYRVESSQLMCRSAACRCSLCAPHCSRI